MARQRGRRWIAARAVAGMAGTAIIVIMIAVLTSAPVQHNPARAARGELIVLALGGLLLWWAAIGRGL